MDCDYPPPLTDDEISAALFGEADASVEEHLQRCAGCLARLEDARRFESTLKTSLFRIDCPDTDQWGAYVMGFLAGNDRQTLAQHLKTCPQCQREVRELQQFMSQPQPVSDPQPIMATLQKSLRRLIAQLIPMQPALALRGKTTRTVAAGVEGRAIFLEFEPNDEGFTLTGQLVAEDESNWSGALLEIRQAGELKASAILDEMHEFRCEGLPAGAYELRLSGGQGYQIILEHFLIE